MNTGLTSRIAGIDCFRAIAIFLIVFVHTDLYNYASRHSTLTYIAINQLPRFAIPFFVIISGYFWGKKIEKTSLDQASVVLFKRILTIYAFWFLIYLLNPIDMEYIQKFGVSAILKTPYWRSIDVLQDPVRLFFQGPKVHLWFLMSLLNSIALCWFFLKLRLYKWLIPAGFALYIFGLFAGSYAHTRIGFPIDFYTRNGPFFTTVFFALGWWFSGRSLNNIKLRWAATLAVLGFLMHMSEVYILSRSYGSFLMTDYLIGTVPWGVGVSIIAMKLFELGKNTFLPALGTYTLGIYAIHYIFIDLLNPINAVVDHYSWEILFPVLVYVLSMVSVLVLAKNSVMRRFVI